MIKPIRQYDSSGSSGSNASFGDSPGAISSNVLGSRGASDADKEDSTPDEYDDGGTTGDGIEGESGVPGSSKDVGDLTGTDRDKTGPGENMATES